MRERGYPDLDQGVEIRKRVRSWGLDVNRVTLPDVSQDFMRGKAGAERELADAVRDLESVLVGELAGLLSRVAIPEG